MDFILGLAVIAVFAYFGWRWTADRPLPLRIAAAAVVGFVGPFFAVVWACAWVLGVRGSRVASR